MASTALACLGHYGLANTNFGVAVQNVDQPGWYPSTFNEFAFGANAPVEVEIEFFTNTTNLDNRVLFNGFQFSEFIRPGLKISCVGTGNPVTFRFRVISNSGTFYQLDVPVTVSIHQWYHALVRIFPNPVPASDHLLQAYVGPVGVGVLGDAPLVPAPFPYPDSAGLLMTGVDSSSGFTERSMRVFGKEQSGQVFSVGVGGTPDGSSFSSGTQWPGGIANFRVWSINRSDTDIDFGARNFYTPETTPGLVHAFRLNETVTAADQFDDVGVKNATFNYVGGTPAGQFSGLSESPINPPSQQFAENRTDTLAVSEAVSRSIIRSPALQDSISLSESNFATNLNFLQGSDAISLSESSSVQVSYDLSVSDSLTVSETTGTVHSDVSSFSAQRTDALTVSESLGRVWTHVHGVSDTLAVSEQETSVKTIGGSGATPWNTAVSNLNPEYWFRLDDGPGISALPIANWGTAGANGSGTTGGLVASQFPPIVEGSSFSISFTASGYILADNPNAWFIPAGQSAATFIMWCDIPSLGQLRYLAERLGNFFLNITANDQLEINVPQSPGVGATRTPVGSITTGVHMLGFSVDPATFGRKLYIDGVPVVSAPASGDILLQTNRFTEFGRDSQTATGGYGMTVDEIVMWNNVALTDQQIADLYSSGTTPGGGGAPVSDTLAVSESLASAKIHAPSTTTVSDTITLSETPTKAHLMNLSVSDTLKPTEGTTQGVTAPQSWGARFRLETNASVIPADLTDFPAFLDFTDAKLKTQANGGEVTNSNGYDIRMYNDAAGISPLDYELVSYDGTTGRVRLWVKIPSLSGSATTNVFLLAGNAGFSTDGSDSALTFSAMDGTSGNSMIWHLDENATGSIPYTDALGNHDATKPNVSFWNTWQTPNVAAQVAQGFSSVFHGGGISAVGSSSNDIFGPNYLFTDVDTSSVSLWFKGNGIISGVEGLLAGWFATATGRRFSFVVEPTGHTIEWQWYDQSLVKQTISTGIDLDTDTAWHHLYATWDRSAGANGTMTVYVDGAQVGQDTTSGVTDAAGEPNIAAHCCTRYDGNNGYKGTFDEARIMDVAPTASWISTEYTNQLDATVAPANFWGAAVDVSAGIKYTVAPKDTISTTETLASTNSKLLEAAIVSGSAVPTDPVKGDVLLSVVEIWNTALTALGSDTVTSTSDSTVEATILNGQWPIFRRQWLAQNLWNGAKTTKTLSRFQNSDGTDVSPQGTRWTYAYQLPDSTDSFPYIQAITLNGRELQPDNRQFEIEAVENDAGTIKRCLLTDESRADLEYIFDTKDANIDLLAPLVKYAMGLALAVHVANRFGRDSQIPQLQQMAQEAAVQAKAADGQEGTLRRFQNHPIIDVRR